MICPKLAQLKSPGQRRLVFDEQFERLCTINARLEDFLQSRLKCCSIKDSNSQQTSCSCNWQNCAYLPGFPFLLACFDSLSAVLELHTMQQVHTCCKTAVWHKLLLSKYDVWLCQWRDQGKRRMAGKQCALCGWHAHTHIHTHAHTQPCFD